MLDGVYKVFCTIAQSIEICIFIGGFTLLNVSHVNDQWACLCLLQVKMPPMMEIITAEQLMEYLGKGFAALTQEQVDATSSLKEPHLYSV